MMSDAPFADFVKIGLESNKKYDKNDVRKFVYDVIEYYDSASILVDGVDTKIYFKDSLLKQAGINREDLSTCCVTRDFNMFILYPSSAEVVYHNKITPFF